MRRSAVLYCTIHCSLDSIYGVCATGDIMGARETYTRIPLSFSPVERIILTANGNLQRVLR